VSVVKDPYEACDGAHAICVLTEWDEFKQLDFPRLYARCVPMQLAAMRRSALVSCTSIIVRLLT
jgi:UDP-glucose 6-dehydrogenase